MVKFENNTDYEKLNALFETRDDNIFVASLYNFYFDNKEFLGKETLKTLEKEFGLSEKSAYQKMFFESLELINNEETQKKINAYKVLDIKKLKEKDLESNEYYKTVKPKEVKINNYHLYYKDYMPYEGFIYDDLEISSEYKEYNKFGYFEKGLKYLAIDKDNQTWMSITPHEINTMKNGVKSAKGNVLIYGLGLGYFAFMCSLKSEVTSITIVEKDKKIIDIFNRNILPFFDKKVSLKIVNDDAIAFNKKLNNPNNTLSFDYCYVDLWHDPLDGLKTYCSFKKYENEKIKYDYWIETSLLAYLRRFAITIFIEEYEGYTDKDYKDNSTFSDKLINALYYYYKRIKFTSFEQLSDSLSDKSLKEAIKKLNFR